MKKLFIVILLFFIAHKAHGAVASLSVQSNDSGVLAVSVLVDTQGEIFNTANVVLSFDTQALEFKGYDDIGAIRMWVEVPRVNGSEVSFAGIMPGGVLGVYDPREADTVAPLTLATLFFESKEVGSKVFKLESVELLKHDGLGSALPVVLDSQVVEAKTVEDLSPQAIDSNPPTDFQVNLIKSSFFSKTPQLIFFQATDAETGVMKYMIKGALGAWLPVESPYPLPNTFFNRNIMLRAYDFDGNFTETSILVPGSVSLAVVLFSGLVLVIALFYLYKLLK